MNSKKPWVHFIAICGTGMGAVAVVLKSKGYRVTGSDIDFYPPISDLLRKTGVKIETGFDATRISSQIDMVVIGGSALIDDRNNPEFVQAKKLKLPIKTYPELIAEYVIRPESIVVAGTYGKTTVSAMIAWVFKNMKVDASYFVPGIAVDLPEPIHLGESSFSVAEGDEYPAAVFFDNESKFMFYKPKFVILTSVEWDHFDVFPKEKDYIQRFVNLMKIVPKDGLVVAPSSGKNVEKVLGFAGCKVVRFSSDNFSEQLQVIGRHNRANAAGVFTLLCELGFPREDIIKGLSNFRGVKRRLEVIYKDKNLVVINDFAQHPSRLKASIDAVREEYKKRLVVVLDPHASIFKDPTILKQLSIVFDKVDALFILRLKLLKGHHKVTGPLIVKASGLSDVKTKYIPLDEDLVKELLNQAKKGNCVIMFCSSGGIDSLIQKFVAKLK